MHDRFLLTTALAVAVCWGWFAPIGVALEPGGQPRDGARRYGKPAPRVGQVAPALKLKTLDTKKDVDLKDSVGKQPVLLLFGSYT